LGERTPKGVESLNLLYITLKRGEIWKIFPYSIKKGGKKHTKGGLLTREKKFKFKKKTILPLGAAWGKKEGASFRSPGGRTIRESR